MKFSENGFLITQKVSYSIKHDEMDEELIDKCLQKKTNFQIDYDHEGNAIFLKNRVKEGI